MRRHRRPIFHDGIAARVMGLKPAGRRRLRLRALARKPGPQGHAQTQLNGKISFGIMG
jgi:hypothetical protein